MAKLNSIKIYEDGTMIAITTDADIPIASEPFGNVRVRPFGTAGFSFVRLSTNEAIADILDFNLILDGAGAPYSGTYLGTFSALNAFLDKCCPGGGGGGGEANTASNVGAGLVVFKQKVGVDLQFKSLIAGSGISLVSGVDDITISSTGTAGVYDFLYEDGAPGEQQTSSLVYQNVITRSVSLVAGKRYKFSFYYSFRMNATNRAGFVRCYIVDPTTIETEVNEMRVESKDPNNYIPYCTAQYITAGQTGVYDIKIDVRVLAVGATASIKEITIETLGKI